jgi:hypothetical protein
MFAFLTGNQSEPEPTPTQAIADAFDQANESIARGDGPPPGFAVSDEQLEETFPPDRPQDWPEPQISFRYPR